MTNALVKKIGLLPAALGARASCRQRTGRPTESMHHGGVNILRGRDTFLYNLHGYANSGKQDTVTDKPGVSRHVFNSNGYFFPFLSYALYQINRFG